MIKRYFIIMVVFCFINKAYTQCDNIKILNDFSSGKIKCFTIDSSIIHLNQETSYWRVISSIKKHKSFDLIQIVFYPDSTALIETDFGIHHVYVDPFVTGITENLSCSYESKLGDMIYNLSVTNFNGELLILKVKERSKNRWRKKGYFLLKKQDSR